jgi:hypothetical protein
MQIRHGLAAVFLAPGRILDLFGSLRAQARQHEKNLIAAGICWFCEDEAASGDDGYCDDCHIHMNQIP